MASKFERSVILNVQKELSETLNLLREAKKKWDELSQRGTQAGNEIVNITGNLYTTSQSVWGALEQLPDVKARVNQKLELKRLHLQEQLGLVVAELIKLYTKLRAKVFFFDRTVQDAAFQLGSATIAESPLFALTPASRYVETCHEALAMFTKDLFMKQSIVGDISIQKDRNVLIAYLAAWLTSPFIDSQRLDDIFFAFDTDEGAYEPPQSPSPISSPASNSPRHQTSSSSSSPKSSPSKTKSSTKSKKK